MSDNEEDTNELLGKIFHLMKNEQEPANPEPPKKKKRTREYTVEQKERLRQQLANAREKALAVRQENARKRAEARLAKKAEPIQAQQPSPQPPVAPPPVAQSDELQQLMARFGDLEKRISSMSKPVEQPKPEPIKVQEVKPVEPPKPEPPKPEPPKPVEVKPPPQTVHVIRDGRNPFKNRRRF